MRNRLSILFLFLLVTSLGAVHVKPVNAAYDVTIWAWDSAHGWLAMDIYEGNFFTGFKTPHTFTGLTGTHFYQVPSVDYWGNPFIEWNTGATSTLVVTEGGTYTARYYEIYSVTIGCYIVDTPTGLSIVVTGLPIAMDGVDTGLGTFADLHGTHTFTVPSTFNFQDTVCTFKQWDTGETSTSITVSSGGTHAAQYSFPKVAHPAFSPNPTGIYSSSVSVTISCSTSGATILYTLDGSQPTSSSTIYSSPILISSTTTIRAKAFKSGMTDSDTASATYTINVQPAKVATPMFSPPGGTYSNGQSVTISCSTSGATIRYTLNGAEPSSSSTLYSGPISISSTTTVKAKAFKSGMTESNTASATYTINVPVYMRELSLSVVGSGSTSPAPGTYSYVNGTEVPVQAIASTNWSFDHWVLDGTTIVFSINPIYITMGRDRTVTAVFIRVPPTTESCDSTGVAKNRFTSSESIYVKGIGYGQEAGADVYVVHDVAWTDGMAIPVRVSGTVVKIYSDMSGEIPPTAIWSHPLADGKYDICVDVNGNGVYDAEMDALDDNEVEVSAGFVVPEYSALALLLLLALATPTIGLTRKKLGSNRDTVDC